MALPDENRNITEFECGTNFSYIVKNAASFLSTEYKVLQSQTNGCFVKCMKMLYNGDTQLFYITTALKPFSSLIPTLDSERFLVIVANLLADLIDVKHNGFLSCRNIDISFTKIFIDPTTYKVFLVYIPIKETLYADEMDFENDIRTNLVRLITTAPNLSSAKTMQLSSDLSNGTLSVEDLYNRLKGVKATEVKAPPAQPHGDEKHLKIIAMNAPMRIELIIDKPSFVIGKKKGSVDGILPFNDKISRIHCRIDQENGTYTITDLQSANGTYINGARLQPNRRYLLKPGDVIRLANSDFQVAKG